MIKKKIVYVISGVHNSISFEWQLESQHRKDDIVVILLDNRKTVFFDFLEKTGIDNHFIQLNSKKNYPLIFIRVLRLLWEIKPVVVHCHLFDANIIGLAAASVLRVKKRFYTRHHSTFHLEYAKKGVKYDKLCNLMATRIIAPSENVKNVLVNFEKVPERKVKVVRHGFKGSFFNEVSDFRVHEIEKKYNIKDSFPVIGVMARYIEWKGVDFIVEAFEEIIKVNPKAKLLIANAVGAFRPAKIDSINGKYDNSIIEIPYERDTGALYKTFDIYIHTPISRYIEAFGQTYVESMLAQVPAVFTLSGIGIDIIKNGVNAEVVDYKNSESILHAVNNILASDKISQNLRSGRDKLQKEFGVERMTDELHSLYRN